jgi:hypothetical protein
MVCILLITYRKFPLPEANDPVHVRKGYKALVRWHKLKIVRRALERTRKQMIRLDIQVDDLVPE